MKDGFRAIFGSFRSLEDDERPTPDEALRGREDIRLVPDKTGETRPASNLAAKEPSVEKIGLVDSDPFWEHYVAEAKEVDDAQVESWNQDLEALLIFVSRNPCEIECSS